ncbi:MAG: TldD/PmbA family protein [Bacillota bacterium]
MLDKRIGGNILNEALAKGGDFAELFLEDRNTTNIRLVEGEVRDSLTGRDYGVGIRILDGTNSIYGFTNDSSEESLVKLAKSLSSSLNRNRQMTTEDFKEFNNPDYNPVFMRFSDVKKGDKIELLRQAYNAAKDYDQVISQVSAAYMEDEQKVLIANSEGLWTTDIRTRTRFSVSSAASYNGEIQQGYHAPGASMGYEFYDDFDVIDIGREASRIAETMIFAEYAPSGNMPVVIENGFGGVLFHEACGHALEAAFVSKGTSAFGNRLGELVASPQVTAIDDGTIKNGWGTTNVDDEGTPTGKNILIENGILKSYLIDRLNGRRMGLSSTGSSRRQSYRYAPTSRMNNTFIASGSSNLEEMVESIDRGLYARKLGGGSVNPATGEFNFAVMEGYLIENGRITAPVRGATLVGNGIEVLRLIDMVGNNMELGQGMCRASSGSIPANVGQPAIRVSSITVGGRKGMPNGF